MTGERAPGSVFSERRVRTVVVARVWSTLLDLTLAVVLVRLLPKADVAVVAFCLLLLRTSRSLATLGLPESVFFFYERVARGARRAFVRQTFLVLGAIGVCVGALIASLTSWLPDALENWGLPQREVLGESLPLVALMAFLEVSTAASENTLLAAGRPRASALLNVVAGLSLAGGFFGPLLVTGSVVAAFLGLLVAFGVRAALAVALVVAALRGDRPVDHGRPGLPPRLLRRQLSFSLPVGLSTAAGRLNKQIDKYVVASLLPATALAAYEAGAQELPVANVIPHAVGAALASVFVRLRLERDDRALLSLWHESVRRVSPIVVPIGVLGIALAPDLIVALFGADYLDAVLPFRIYNVILLHRVANYGTLFQSLGDPRGALKMTLAVLGLNATLSVPFTLQFGLAGAAASTLVANSIVIYFAFRRLAEHLAVPVGRLMPYGHYARVLAAAALAAAGVVWLRSFADSTLSPWLQLAWTVPLFGVVFWLLARRLRVFDSEAAIADRRSTRPLSGGG